MAKAKDKPTSTPQDDLREREFTGLRDAYDHLRDRFTLLADLSRRLITSLDPANVLRELVEAACELTQARYGAMAIFDGDGRIQEFITHGISEKERKRIGDLPKGLGLLGLLQERQEPMRLADLAKHPRSIGFPKNHPPMNTFLGVPVRHEARALGNIYLTEKKGGEEFTPEDEALLLLLAAHAAVAINNARVHQAAEVDKQRLQTLVDTSPTGVFVVDAASNEVLLANREAQRLLGIAYKPGDSLAHYEQEVIYRRPDGSQFATEELPLQLALKNGETARAVEISFEFADGRKVPTLVNASPIYGPNGAITAAIAVIQDIKPIEELERLRNEFLGIVSHELKTPLTAIKGSAAMVLGSKRPLDQSESIELFEIIDEQADRLRDLVDNLLDMTRIEAGSLSVSTESTDLKGILEDALNSFLATNRDREVRLDSPDELPPVNIDPRRVGQVVANLLSNAAKFSPENSPIDLTVENGGDLVTVHVRDQGRGIAEDQMHVLFQKFSQIPEASNPAHGGNGLGLAICKGIVEAHGGRVWAQSGGPGQGSTFSFTLPVAVESPPSHQPDITQRANHVGRVGRSGERTRILVVDDEPQILRYVQRSLEEAGYHPTITMDPNAVTKLVEMEEPDLVLMDLNLPGVSGFELLERIREFSGVPVIFLTANADSATAARALHAGADDYVTKPFAPSELLARIEASLRRRVLPDQTEVRPPFHLDGLQLDFADRRVTVAGERVALSATEYKLLYALAINAGRVLTHDQILHNVWGPEYSGENELVRSFIRNLRRKLGDDARNPRYILTEPQVGYRMPRPGE